MKLKKLDLEVCMTGEGPVWDVAEQALYYVDIIAKKVHRYHPSSGDSKSWDVPGVVGSMALREQGGALVALADGLYTLDFESGVSTQICKPEGLDPRIQFNDGKVDRRGRFIVGTTDSKIEKPMGNVYSFSADHKLSQIDDGITISNGPCWSPDNKTFYFSDSKKSVMYAYDYDIETGETANRRIFVNTEDLGGFPDGVTVDADGLIWTALCEGGKVVAWRPDGKVERIIDMPVTLPSSVMFGGPDLDQLYVTTLDPQALSAFRPNPNNERAGETYVIEGLGARGLPEPRFAG